MFQQPNWYHYSCFFGRFRPKSVDEIGHFHNLRWEDQEKVRTQVEREPSAAATAKKRKGSLVSKSLQDFMIQYALSGKSTCKKCGEKIEKVSICLFQLNLNNFCTSLAKLPLEMFFAMLSGFIC